LSQESELAFTITEADVFVDTTSVKSFDVSSMRRASSGISLEERPQNNMETTSARENRWRVLRAQFISTRLYIERSANSTLENRSRPPRRVSLFFTKNHVADPRLFG